MIYDWRETYDVYGQWASFVTLSSNERRDSMTMLYIMESHFLAQI